MRNWQNIKKMQSTPLSKEFLESQDCILIATDHSDYDYDFIVQNASLIVDSRNATKNVKNGRDKIVRA
jgi:UDP-N-acetyl-D-glucosamine dehydrogenase